MSRATEPGRPPRRPSLRARLVVWFVAVLITTLLAFAAVLFFSVRYGLWREFDLRLQHEVETARGLLAPFWTIDGISAPDYINPLPEHDRRWAEVWTPDGEQLFQSPQAEAEPLEGVPAPRAGGFWSTTSGAGEPIRVLDEPTDIIGLPVVVRVVQSEAALRAQLRLMAGSIAAGFVLCVAVAVWGGHRITKRALRPMEQLVEQAAAVRADRLSHGLVIENADDEVSALATAFNDMLRRLDVSFEHARRFSADASHELRTPLTAIRTVGQVALQDRRDGQDYRDAIGSMVEDAERLGRLLDTLLLLSRADAGQMGLQRQDLDLTALVRDVIGQCDVLAEEKHQTIVLESAPITVHGDSGVLHLALLNLLDNAIRYSPVGSRIAVRVSAMHDRAVVAVQDAGPGIAPEHHARLFDRFYRVERDRSRQSGGTGLGLSIAWWAAAAHDGRITVESAPGVGSTFRLDVPAA